MSITILDNPGGRVYPQFGAAPGAVRWLPSVGQASGVVTVAGFGFTIAAQGAVHGAVTAMGCLPGSSVSAAAG